MTDAYREKRLDFTLFMTDCLMLNYNLQHNCAYCLFCQQFYQDFKLLNLNDFYNSVDFM